MAEPILVARHGDIECQLLPALANRHGLITGATGTGKTITLQTLAENFSKLGVPVFMADVKGDLSGISQPGSIPPKMAAVLQERGIEPPAPRACPCTLWDVFADGAKAQGHPVRATISDMGPLLLGRMLGLNETQSGVLSVVFKVADDSGLLLLDLKDLRAMLQHVGDNAAQYKTEYGNVSAASIGAIQRGLLQIGEQGGDRFFGEPMLDIADFMQSVDGQGVINILAADKLMNAPRLYATFLLWMLSELFEQLPEVGDLDKPKLVFFFDEAHLLFDDAPPALQQRIEQVVRIIRSKGVGVYFITQSPSDIPDEVLAQLSNRVQHGLRAFTPTELKSVRAAAESFRANPAFDSAQALQDCGTGEALVSLLDADGKPCIVQRAKVLFPRCLMGKASDATMDQVYQGQQSLLARYGTAVDRESAYEQINKQHADAEANDKLAEDRAALEKERADFEKEQAAAADKAAKEQARADERARRDAEKESERQQRQLEREAEAAYKRQQQEEAREERERQKQQEQVRKQAQSVIGTIGREATRQLVRGIFGSLRR